MGLSNEERIEKTFSSVKFLVEEAEKLPKKSKLRKLCGQLWHALLGGTENGGHWLFGSATSDTIKENTCDPWSIAVRWHVRDLREDAFPKEDEFNPFEGFLWIPDLLGQVEYGGAEMAATFNIYQGTESLIYSVRRYNDGLRKQDLRKLDKLISDIQGACFESFSAKEEYAKAYLLFRTCVLIFGGQTSYFKKEDPVITWILNDHVYHKFNRPMRERWEFTLKDLGKLHMGLSKALKDDAYAQKPRVLAALTLAGTGFHYGHQRDDLLKRLKAAGWSKEDLKEVETIAKKAEADHEKNKEEYSEDYRKKAKGEELGVYGYFPDDLFREPKAPKKPSKNKDSAES